MPKRSFQVTVEAIEGLTPTVKVFRLGFAADAGFDFVAGQYVMVVPTRAMLDRHIGPRPS